MHTLISTQGGKWGGGGEGKREMGKLEGHISGEKDINMKILWIGVGGLEGMQWRYYLSCLSRDQIQQKHIHGEVSFSYWVAREHVYL